MYVYICAWTTYLIVCCVCVCVCLSVWTTCLIVLFVTITAHKLFHVICHGVFGIIVIAKIYLLVLLFIVIFFLFLGHLVALVPKNTT